jgi:hypothetical protein
VLNIAITNYSSDADPVTFSDGSVYNIHNIRKVAISCGASGSGDVCDYTDLVRGTVSETIDPLTFEAGFQGTPDVPLSYTITPDGFVHWQGKIELDASYSAPQIWLAGGMPAEARPEVNSFVCIRPSSVSSGSIGSTVYENMIVLQIYADGRITVRSVSSSFTLAGNYIDFTGLSYKVA